MTPQETRAMRREQVERCLSTTMTIKDWCALNGVPESTMYFWMSRFRKEEPELFGEPNSGGWIEITRESIAQKTALSTREEAAAKPIPAPMPGAVDAGIQPAAVVVRLNGADVVLTEMPNDGKLDELGRIDRYLPWSEEILASCRLSVEGAEEAAGMPDEPIVDAEALEAALENSNSFTAAVQ